jgi:glycosyltransferase involved in cell wall biosynthesis
MSLTLNSDSSFNTQAHDLLFEGEGRKGEGGLRANGHFKQSYEKRGGQWYVCNCHDESGEVINLTIEFNGTHLPLITVVTVVFNGERFIEETILSVLNQTYPNIEYIIIDGGSTDGTLDIIRKYENEIDYWLSERDAGIYDAMNKGIEAATGEWINFMNAGDIFFSPETITRLFNGDKYDEAVLYGNVQIRYPEFSRIEVAGKLNKLWTGMQFCHQSAFVRARQYKLTEFNTANRIAADLEYFYSVYKNGLKFKYIDQIISSVNTGGLSEGNRVKTIMASRDAICSSGGGSLIRLVYILFYFEAKIRYLAKKILPKKIVQKIIQMKS